MKSYSSSRGDAGAAEPYPFTLDGVEFVAPGGIMLLDICEIARGADLDIQDPRAVAAIADLFEGALGKEQYRSFKDHCRKHSTTPDMLLLILKDMIEEVTGRPTVRSSPSSPGPQTMNGTSNTASPSSTSDSRPEGHYLTAEEIAAWLATRNQQPAQATIGPLGIPTQASPPG